MNERDFFEKRLEQDGVREPFVKNMIMAEDTEQKTGINLNNFSYEYKNGAKIKSFVTQEEIVKLIITLPNKQEVNFDQFLPKGYLLVTKEFVTKMFKDDPRSLYYHVNNVGDFYHITEEKLVVINKLANPQQLLIVLHEVGHAIDENAKFEIKKTLENTLLQQEFKETFPKLSNKVSSKQERSANANALKLYRKIKKDFDVDLLEPFGSFEEIQKTLYTFLSHYRYGAEFDFETSKTDSKWLNSKLYKLFGQEDYSFLEKLYDKGKLSRLAAKSEDSE